MEKEIVPEYTLPKIGTDIFNQKKNYRVIGHGIGIANGNEPDELPLNEIDRKIIDFIKSEEESLLDEVNNKHGFDEDIPHECDDTCSTLQIDIAEYIDNVLDQINIFALDHKNNWTKDYYTLGFYRPFHFYSDWGIFIKSTGQARRTRSLKRNIDSDSKNQFGNPDIDTCYLISKTFTFFHEFYHHKIESLAVRFELTTRLPYYTTGFHCLYCNTFNTDRCLEEAFAHTYAFFETCKSLQPYLSRMGISSKQLRHILKNLIIRNSPPGYNVAEKIIAANSYDEAKVFEYHFFEAVLRYSHKLITGNNLDPLSDEMFWKNFKHATHPILFKENEVTYVVDLDDVTNIQVQNFLIP